MDDNPDCEAPLLLCSSLDPVKTILVVGSPLNEAFRADLARLSPAPVQTVDADPNHPSDLWIQDAVEFAVAIETDARGRRRQRTLALLGLRGRHDQGLIAGPLDERVARFIAERHPDAQTLQPGDPLPGRRWIDWYGNLEVSPPVPGFPYGRILTGKQRELTLHPRALGLLERRSPQAPPLFLDVSWLTIGHVDEVINFVPAPGRPGWRALLPSPARAAALLDAAVQGGEGETRLWVGTVHETTIRGLREAARSGESATIEAALQETKRQLQSALGIGPQHIIELPCLFQEGLALTPNPVNSLVVGKTVFVPDPGCAPLGQAIRDTLAPLGLTVHLLDVTPYHSRGGEIHCGTNAIRKKRRLHGIAA